MKKKEMQELKLAEEQRKRSRTRRKEVWLSPREPLRSLPWFLVVKRRRKGVGKRQRKKKRTSRTRRKMKNRELGG